MLRSGQSPTLSKTRPGWICNEGAGCGRDIADDKDEVLGTGALRGRPRGTAVVVHLANWMGLYSKQHPNRLTRHSSPHTAGKVRHLAADGTERDEPTMVKRCARNNDTEYPIPCSCRTLEVSSVFSRASAGSTLQERGEKTTRGALTYASS